MGAGISVFISSTFEDLKDHREAVFRSIHSLGGHAHDMLYWVAESTDASTSSLERVRESDVLVLLIAHRYGTVPAGSELSVTELEYREARRAGVSVLAFLVDEEHPWPPRHVDGARRDALERFRESVRRDVVTQTFTTPDNLAMKVTQALAVFREKQAPDRSTVAESPALSPALRVDLPEELRAKPDCVVEIGASEDGLPMLLSIRRSVDLDAAFEGLRRQLVSSGGAVPEGVLDTFRQTIASGAQAGWATRHIHRVRVAATDEHGEDMFVTSSTLTTLFESVLARLFTPAGHAEPLPGGVSAVVGFVSGAWRPLQSLGGRNRFLGISLVDGRRHCVGIDADQQWVRWRDFENESLLPSFPSARYWFGSESGPLDELSGALVRVAREDGSVALPTPLLIDVDRNDVAGTVVSIARAVAELHDRGTIHGDLKPHNVLVTERGIELIDDFALAVGGVAPGWTPDWSAPEQHMGRPVGTSTDVFPLAMMVVRLLGATLVGEVRTIRSLNPQGVPTDFPVLMDPALARPGADLDPDGERAINAWSDVLRPALRSDPENRMESARAFADVLEAALRDHPIEGSVALHLGGSLQVAAFADGSVSVARTLTDGGGPPGGSLPVPAFPPRPGESYRLTPSDTHTVS